MVPWHSRLGDDKQDGPFVQVHSVFIFTFLNLAPLLGDDLTERFTTENESSFERSSFEAPLGTELASEVDQVGYNVVCDCPGPCNGHCGTCNVCQTKGCPGDCGAKARGLTPWWAHRTGLIGEFLLLQPGNSDTIYAFEQNDATANAFPTGPVGTVAVDMAPGFRVGFSLANTETTSFVATYTHWSGNSQDSLQRNNNNVIASATIHPVTPTTSITSLLATASSSIEYNFIDAFYRHKLFFTDTTIFNWSAGMRYGNMQQALSTRQNVSVATGLVGVDTEINFDGFGFMAGLDAERRSCTSGMLCYTKGFASFLGGEWSGRYRQANQFGGDRVANRYDDFRITPVLEAAIGVGWQNDSGCVRATIGYTAQTWFNTLNTQEFIESVRAATYDELSDSISFIGLTSQLEIRF